MKGYHGKILEIDLENKEVEEVELDEEMLKEYLGGTGLCAKLLFDEMTEDLDPLSPENPLAFMTGPFVGPRVPSSGRHAVCAKSPLTNIWGEATSGGFWGTTLKMTGYDGVIFRGKSEDPVYVTIIDGEVEIKDATDYWGKGVYETQDELKEEVGNDRARVSAIGPAGENLVKYASVMNDEGRAAGRTGMGAVMGSKNLKAIVVHGTEQHEIDKPDKIQEDIEEATSIGIDELSKTSTLEVYGEFGTVGYLDMGMTIGDVPAKSFESGIFPTKDIDATKLREKYNPKEYACFGCPLSCGHTIENPPQEGVDEIHGPEYETAAAFGPLNENYDLDSIVHANHLCNDLGLDTISAGVTIAFVNKLLEDGDLSKDDIDVDLDWGNGDAIVELVKKISHREGFGDDLAEGTMRLADKLGVSQERAPHVNGMEIAMHDARAFFGQAISYATSPRGGCHLKGDYFFIGLGIDQPEWGIETRDRFESSEEKGGMAAKWQNIRELNDSLPLCKFSPIHNPDHIANILSDITGWDVDGEQMMKTGERIFNIKRLINWKLGIRGEDDDMPEIAIKALKNGATAGKSPDMDVLRNGYYKERGWDLETGKPEDDKLEELGLSEEAEKL